MFVNSSSAMRISSLGLAMALLCLLFTRSAKAADSPEIVIFRDASYCIGIPNMDVGFDGAKQYLVGPNQFIRLAQPASATSVSFWPAIPEYVPLADVSGTRHWFSATAIRLGWRCKFEIKAISAAEAESRMAAAKEVQVSSTR
jgi:hypothetical protein